VAEAEATEAAGAAADRAGPAQRRVRVFTRTGSAASSPPQTSSSAATTAGSNLLDGLDAAGLEVK